MPLDFAITALVTLFVVVDPIGLAPTFLAVTEGLPRRARRDVAVRASLIAGAILIGTALLGDVLLRALGISLSAFRIAGGLLLFAIAFEMVLGVRMRREGQAAEEAVEEHVRNIAAFPLAIPLMAGPGAITATVLLAGRAYGQMLLVGLLLAVVVVRIAFLPGRLPSGRPAQRHARASPAISSCRGCSACCWRRLPCNMWSTASARSWPDEEQRGRRRPKAIRRRKPAKCVTNHS